MKNTFFFLSLISFLAFTYSLPHFIYDGIESHHECSEDIEKFSFIIYGSLSEDNNLGKIYIPNYLIDDLGELECDLLKNEKIENNQRTHKIVCSIYGSFEKKGYIIEELKVFGFDFNNEKGVSTWPIEPKKKTIMIGECGENIELTNESLFLENLEAYVNPINSVRKDIVEIAINRLPSRNSISEEEMIEAMKKQKDDYNLTDVETAYMLYLWFSRNIEFDCYKKAHFPEQKNTTHEETYNTGKSLSFGISSLFEVMANGLGIEAYDVVGYSKGKAFVPEIVPKEIDHSWNAIKLGSSYYLVDTIWGSGICDDDKYIYNFRDVYFCTNPLAFIRTHLPLNESYEFINPTITLEQFIVMLKLRIAFFDNGFLTVSPDLARFSVDGKKFTISFTHEHFPRKRIITNYKYLQNNSWVDEPNACWVERQLESAQVMCYANKKGEYKLQIYGGPAGSDDYPILLEYEIISSKDADNPGGYPTTYDLFGKSDMQVVIPLYNPLMRGNLINVEFRTTSFNNLYIINNNHYRELDDNGNGVFTGEDVYIFADEVYLATKIDGVYNNIIKYTTIKDPSKETDASFPDSFDVSKNTLYSPLMSTLQAGETYAFRIKCKGANKIAVIEGNNINYLTKEDSLFSGNVKVNGSSKTVNIVMVYDSYYNTFYRYHVDE